VTAASQEHHLVAHHDVLGGVGHQHYRPALVCQPAQESHELGFGAGIQAGGSLVEEEETGPGQQLYAHGHPLALSPAQLLHWPVPATMDVELVEDFLYPLAALEFTGVTRHAQGGGVVQSAHDREVTVDDVVLRDIP